MGVNNEASPPGRHQEQAPKQRCTFRPTTFSSVQFSTIPYGLNSVALLVPLRSVQFTATGAPSQTSTIPYHTNVPLVSFCIPTVVRLAML